MSLYRIEVKKYKGMHLLGILGLVLMIQVLFAGVDLGRLVMGRGNPELIWYQLIQSNAFLKLLLMPVLLATCASISIQLENRHQMWKLIYSSGHRFAETMKMKYRYLFIRYLLGDFLSWGLIFLLSSAFGVSSSVPLSSFVLYLSSTTAVSCAILGVHLFLSLKWSNQAISLSLAILGSLLSLILVFIGTIASYISPYAWYSLLFPLDFEKEGDRFVQLIREPNYYPLVAGMVLAYLFYQGIKVMKGGE